MSRLLGSLIVSVLLVAGCATTEPPLYDDLGDDDDVPGVPDAAPGLDAPEGFVDASAPTPVDAAPGAPDAHVSGPADASPPPGPADAGAPGLFCTTNGQCSSAAHECCWLIVPPDFTSGVCTYGDVVPFLGCVPGDAPDAGP